MQNITVFHFAGGIGKTDRAEFMQTLKSDSSSNWHFFLNLDWGGEGANFIPEGKPSPSSDPTYTSQMGQPGTHGVLRVSSHSTEP